MQQFLREDSQDRPPQGVRGRTGDRDTWLTQQAAPGLVGNAWQWVPPLCPCVNRAQPVTTCGRGAAWDTSVPLGHREFAPAGARGERAHKRPDNEI